MPTVSVIIPTHNRPVYLTKAIQSVLDQTYSDFEVIVVENGSSDDTTVKLVREFNDARIRHVYQAYPGRSAARNFGIKLAKGSYIAFLDDDDLYLPHKLACQVAFLETNPRVDFIAAGMQIIDENDVVQGILRPWQNQPKLTLLNCLYACPLQFGAILFRRQVLQQLCHWFDLELDLAEDKDFFIRLLQVGCQMTWQREIVSAYRVHSTNSQGDGVRYGQSYQRVLDKVFACPDVPTEVKSAQARLYANSHLAGALHSYATRQIKEAQDDLMRALSLDPELGRGSVPAVIERIAVFANTFRVADSLSYIDFVFDHLPDSLAYLNAHQNEARSYLHLGRVFRAHVAGETPGLRDWSLGVWHSPRWLRNRGVWSILRKIIVESVTEHR